MMTILYVKMGHVILLALRSIIELKKVNIRVLIVCTAHFLVKLALVRINVVNVKVVV